MKSEIIEENKILRNKKHLIANEINIKKESLGNFEELVLEKLKIKSKIFNKDEKLKVYWKKRV